MHHTITSPQLYGLILLAATIGVSIGWALAWRFFRGYLRRLKDDLTFWREFSAAESKLRARERDARWKSPTEAP